VGGTQPIGPDQGSGKKITTQLWGILNAIALMVNNGPVEGINSRINMILVRSKGIRNKARFANATDLHFAGLDLYPEGIVR
jgi:transposase